MGKVRTMASGPRAPAGKGDRARGYVYSTAYQANLEHALYGDDPKPPLYRKAELAAWRERNPDKA